MSVAAVAAPEPHRIRCTYKKSTKRYHVFEEQPEPEQQPRLGSVYVRKAAFDGASPPPSIYLTLDIRHAREDQISLVDGNEDHVA